MTHLKNTTLATCIITAMILAIGLLWYDRNEWRSQAKYQTSLVGGLEEVIDDIDDHDCAEPEVPEWVFDDFDDLKRMGLISYSQESFGNIVTRDSFSFVIIGENHWDAFRQKMEDANKPASVSELGVIITDPPATFWDYKTGTWSTGDVEVTPHYHHMLMYPTNELRTKLDEMEGDVWQDSNNWSQTTDTDVMPND